MMQKTEGTGQIDVIEGPFLLGLSPEGVESFIAVGRKAQRIRFFEGTEEFGLEMPNLSFKELLKLAMTGMVSRLQRTVTRFAQERKALMETTRCFASAVVYRQFETRLWTVIEKSDLLIQWNRLYPKLHVAPGVPLQTQAFKLLVQKTQPGILEAKQAVLSVVQRQIQTDPKALPEEKKERILLAIRYINTIDPVIWMLIVASKEEKARVQMLDTLRKLLSEYINRSELPEYLSYLLAELVLMLADVHIADVPMPEALVHEGVHVSFELGRLRKSQEERTKVKILIGNDSGDVDALRSLFDQQGAVQVGNKGLNGFFGSNGMNSNANNSNLGLYYLSYLTEACRKMDISMDSFVNVVPGSQKALVNLILTL